MKKIIALLVAAVLLLACACAFADSVRIKEGSNPNVRNKPSKDGSTVVGNAKSGQVYELLDQKDNWYKIRFKDGTEGWIASGMATIVKTDSSSASGAAANTPKPTATPLPTETPMAQPTVPPSIHVAEVKASIVATNTALEESCSQPVMDVNGFRGFVSEVYITGGNEFVIYFSFRNSNEDIRVFYPEISNLKVNGQAYEMGDSYRLGIHSASNISEDAFFVATPKTGSLPNVQDITTIEFTLSATDGYTGMGYTEDGQPFFNPSNEKWYGLTYVMEDHVLVTVDPNMERGQAAGVFFAAKGRAIHADGSLAFTYSDAYDRVVSCHGGLAFVERCINKEESLYGIIDLTGREIVPVEMENLYVGAFPDGLIPAKKDGKWGFMDTQGSFVIEPQYDYYRPFSEGVAAVFIGTLNAQGSPDQGKYYFIDHNNQRVVDLGAWDYVYTGSAGRARVKKDGLWGMIDLVGNVVIEPKYESVGDLTNGRTYVKQDGKYAVADENGQLLSDFVFDSYVVFSAEGAAVVKENGKARMVNADMETVADLSAYSYVDWNRNAGIALCYSGELSENGIPHHKDYKEPYTFDLIDHTGKVIMTLDADDVNVTVVPGQGVIYSRRDDTYARTGMADFAGNTLIPFVYNDIYTTGVDDVFLTYRYDSDYVNMTFTSYYALYSLKDGEYAQIDFDPKTDDTDFTYRIDLSEGMLFVNPRMMEE